MESVRDAQTTITFNLADYASGLTSHRRVYLRSDLRRPEEPVTPYHRLVTTGSQREGVFVGCEIDDLKPYLTRPGEAEPDRYLDWPTSGKDRWLGLFLEFDPPLVYLPESVCSDTELCWECVLRIFNRWGHRLRVGQMKRSIRVEGHEDIVVDGVPYKACLRLVLDMRIRIRWGPWVDVTEYLWLARGVGEVRRVQRIQVWAFLLFFDEAYSYELAAGQEKRRVKPATVRKAGETRPTVAAGQERGRSVVSHHPGPASAWSRMVIFLDRFLPRLRVGGMFIETVTPVPHCRCMYMRVSGDKSATFSGDPKGSTEKRSAENGEWM